jgi:hypothetical protein
MNQAWPSLYFIRPTPKNHLTIIGQLDTPDQPSFHPKPLISPNKNTPFTHNSLSSHLTHKTMSSFVPSTTTTAKKMDKHFKEGTEHKHSSFCFQLETAHNSASATVRKC